jgi:hypothetical protein
MAVVVFPTLEFVNGTAVTTQERVFSDKWGDEVVDDLYDGWIIVGTSPLRLLNRKTRERKEIAGSQRNRAFRVEPEPVTFAPRPTKSAVPPSGPATSPVRKVTGVGLAARATKLAADADDSEEPPPRGFGGVDGPDVGSPRRALLDSESDSDTVPAPARNLPVQGGSSEEEGQGQKPAGTVVSELKEGSDEEQPVLPRVPANDSDSDGGQAPVLRTTRADSSDEEAVVPKPTTPTVVAKTPRVDSSDEEAVVPKPTTPAAVLGNDSSSDEGKQPVVKMTHAVADYSDEEIATQKPALSQAAAIEYYSDDAQPAPKPVVKSPAQDDYSDEAESPPKPVVNPVTSNYYSDEESAKPSLTNPPPTETPPNPSGVAASNVNDYDDDGDE